MVGPIMVMLREHGQLWDGMDALDGMLAGEAQAAATAARRSMLEQLERHNAKQANAKEEPMPAGWVCEAAGGGMPAPFGR